MIVPIKLETTFMSWNSILTGVFLLSGFDSEYLGPGQKPGSFRL